MQPGNQDFTGSNIKVYEQDTTVKHYEGYTELQNAELTIIGRITAEFSNKRILDIGVGAGRTTPALVGISKNYIGLDISPPMITACRRRFPSASFDVGDVRDLCQFGDKSFDLVFFSHNGIDSIEHLGRLKALGEIYRVLDYRGAFVFSSHNRRSIIKKPWHSTKLPWRINPFKHPRRFSKRFFELAVETSAHLRYKRYERYYDEFAIINDGACGYSLLLYYVNVEAQIRQLKGIGFESVEAVDRAGNWLADDDYSRCQDTWIYYLCRKV